MRFLVLFFFLVEMQWIPAGRCVTMPVWFTVCKAGYYLEAPAARIVTPSNGGGEMLQAQPFKCQSKIDILPFTHP